MILAPISINLTVSTNAELTMHGCVSNTLSTVRPGIALLIHGNASSFSSTDGGGAVYSGQLTDLPMYGAHKPS
jgi:hypothetical protein